MHGQRNYLQYFARSAVMLMCCLPLGLGLTASPLLPGAAAKTGTDATAVRRVTDEQLPPPKLKIPEPFCSMPVLDIVPPPTLCELVRLKLEDLYRVRGRWVRYTFVKQVLEGRIAVGLEMPAEIIGHDFKAASPVTCYFREYKHGLRFAGLTAYEPGKGIYWLPGWEDDADQWPRGLHYISPMIALFIILPACLEIKGYTHDVLQGRRIQMPRGILEFKPHLYPDGYWPPQRD